jgi:hypothetical protein
MSKSLFDPFGGDVNPRMPPAPVRVKWDYEKQEVVSDGQANLFDNCWSYFFYGADEALQWGLSRYEGDHLFIVEGAVPEVVRLAVMVME